jgi:hypothetical protein
MSPAKGQENESFIAVCYGGFDERRQETGLRQPGLRGTRESAADLPTGRLQPPRLSSTLHTSIRKRAADTATYNFMGLNPVA